MSIFICEKCGRLDNTAKNNNYWIVKMNRNMKTVGEEYGVRFKPEFSYFEDHFCCSDCCDGVQYMDGSVALKKSNIDLKDKEHWTKYGKDTLLEWEKRNDGSMVNASEYFNKKKDKS